MYEKVIFTINHYYYYYFPGEPICAPPNETMAQGYIDLLRALHNSSKLWQNSIETCIQHQIRQIDPISEYETLHEIQDMKKVKDLVDNLTKQVWPLLAFICGFVVESLRIGSKVTVISDGDRYHNGYILGSASAKTGHVKVSGLPNR